MRRRQWPHWRYVRLRHRIFGSILASICMTAFIVMLATHLFGHRNELTEMEDFVANRFGEVWNDPTARDRLASELEKMFGVSVTLADASGRRLYGGMRCYKPDWQTPIQNAMGTVGTMGVCLHRPPKHAVTVALGAVAGLLILWGASGAITWRLVRPVDELLRVTQEIGNGNLAARMRLRRHHRDELGEMAQAVNDMAVRIEKQIGDQRELLAGVSHEIRTPLARLRVLVELERSMPHDPKRLDAIEAELIEIDGLVGQLLAQSKLDFRAIDKRRLGANELAAAALERAGLSPTLLTGLDSDDSIVADPSLIARALANLIDNAQRHGEGLVELSITRVYDQIQFAALDDGPGIAADVMARLFLPFQRNGKSAGLGLGLALVERIARAHGGNALAEPRPGGGACVGLRVPAQQ